jgi:proline iminopeptidase/L-proline amide hydrolase
MWGPTEFVATGTLKDYDGEPLLAKLDGRRTLILVGQHDEARPITAAAFAERVPNMEFGVVPGAAHWIFGDRPDDTIALLRGWLSRHDAER